MPSARARRFGFRSCETPATPEDWIAEVDVSRRRRGRIRVTGAKLLALDFDGVISDSAPECFVVGLRTYADLKRESRLAEEAASLLSGRVPRRDRVDRDPLYRSFVDLMPLGNRAEDFGIALRALEARAFLPDQASYDAFRSQLSEEWLHAFHQRFYEIRTALAREDPDRWEQLMGSYPEFLAVLRRRAREVELAIATAKDRLSVQALLRSYGIDDLFPAERILDKETGVHKTAHLQWLQGCVGCEFSEITFVDDKVNHLDSVASLGVRCVLAEWGYNGAREIELARSRGYLVCSLSEVEAQLFGV